jgi:ectoine hydroxylase-related dioxygenase (phytanoyl-CoA dioxygenase family)
MTRGRRPRSCGPPVKELSAQNTDQVVVTVSTGSLLLFPSWLPHSVDANRSSIERISISFNVMFRAFGETLAKPLWGEP